MRAELEAFIRQASQAEIAAYRSLDASPLQAVYTGQLLNLFVSDIATVAANGVAAARTLSAQQVTNIQAGGGLYAQRLVSRLHYDMDRAKHTALKTARMDEYIGQV